MNTNELRLARNRAVDARRRKRNRLAKINGEPTGLIDATPVRVRTKALLEMGWSHEAIAHMSRAPITAAGLRLIANGTSRRCERKFAPVADLPLSLNVPAHVPETCMVPSLGATRRVRALMAIGWRHDDISEFIERASHHLSAGLYPRMLALDWQLVDAAYSRLSAAPGGSVKSKSRATKAGYAPPLAWTDIDDPGEQPRDWEYVPTSRADVFAELVERGDGRASVCRVLHISESALERWCERTVGGEVFRMLGDRDRGYVGQRNQYSEEAS